ncbi:MAG: DUF5036 family protein [Prevotellaceae bacterium]|jgi:hypothetical protein|nr:DUF5036 family protein [Prevotellaceae bacterium]
MYQKTTKTKAGADFNSAMEQKPFEKRASLKSQKSRRNFLMTTLVVLCLFFSNTALFAHQITMKASGSEVLVSINLEGDRSRNDAITIDWGDGTKSNTGDGLLKRIRLLGGVMLSFYHQYTDKRTHTIFITAPYIQEVECSFTQLTSLDVSNCPLLNELDCGQNQLTDLDISNCHYLTNLRCSSNQLTNLDISNCHYLSELRCGGNQLRSLDVSNCPKLKVLVCGGNQLRSLDVRNCTKLIELRCGGNPLRNLDVSNCTALEVLNVGGCTSLETLICNICDKIIFYSKGCPRLKFQLPNPEGTISINVRNSSNGNTVVTPSGFDYGFYIGSDNNFSSNSTTYHAGYYYQFFKIGKVNGLRNVIEKSIPETGWTDIAAVTPGHGYIAKYRYKIEKEKNHITWYTRYIRIYVVREILEAAEHEAVLGAEIEYIVEDERGW